MKLRSWVWLIAGTVLSCRESVLTEQTVSNLPLRLASRTDIRPNNLTNKANTARYSYDPRNRVVRIDRDQADRDILYLYQNDLLMSRLTQSVSDGQLLFKDTFQYNADGKMTRKIAVQNGSTWTYNYRYNQAGQFVEIEQ